MKLLLRRSMITAILMDSSQIYSQILHLQGELKSMIGDVLVCHLDTQDCHIQRPFAVFILAI